MSERIAALQEGRAHEVYDIKVTRCLWRQLFREVFLFGLLVYSICHSLCTHLCIRPFLCMESLLPFPPHLNILSSWQVLLGVIDKRQSLANERVIFKTQQGLSLRNCRKWAARQSTDDNSPPPPHFSIQPLHQMPLYCRGRKASPPSVSISLFLPPTECCLSSVTFFSHHWNDRQVKLAAALIGESWQILQSQFIVDEGVERREKQTAAESERERESRGRKTPGVSDLAVAAGVLLHSSIAFPLSFFSSSLSPFELFCVLVAGKACRLFDPSMLSSLWTQLTKQPNLTENEEWQKVSPSRCFLSIQKCWWDGRAWCVIWCVQEFAMAFMCQQAHFHRKKKCFSCKVSQWSSE